MTLVKEDQLSKFATFAFIFDIEELTPAQKKKKFVWKKKGKKKRFIFTWENYKVDGS